MAEANEMVNFTG